MSMSKDRVRFVIPGSRLSTSCDADKYRQLVEDVFGECLGRCDWHDVTIICRTSQFARFMIERHRRGIQNQFSELKPELFMPEPEQATTILDVSANPNCPRRLSYGKKPR